MAAIDPPPEWVASEELARGLSAGRSPQELAAGGSLEVRLAAVRALLGRWELDAADALLDTLGSGAQGPPRAAAIALRQLVRSARDLPLDRPALAAAASELIGAARWQDAFDASSLLASAAGELAEVRRHRLQAIGCAEAAGAVYSAAAQLRLLAAAELAAGGHARCLAHLGHALRRLDGVLLIGARLEQARCHELAGDARAAAGDRAGARASYELAVQHQAHPDLSSRQLAALAAKRDACG